MLPCNVCPAQRGSAGDGSIPRHSHMISRSGSHGHARPWLRLGHVAAVALLCVAGLFSLLVILHFYDLQRVQLRTAPLDRHQVLLESRVVKKSPYYGRTIAIILKNESRVVPAVRLPNFAVDKSEYVFSSLIERSSKSPLDLHITTLLLSHSYLQVPDLDLRRVDDQHRDDWRAAALSFRTTHYYPSGRRKFTFQTKYTCRIAHTNSSESYVVSGEFVPQRTSSSMAGNRRLDILRCPMLLTDQISLIRLASSDHQVKVSLYRGEDPIITFFVPWRSRGTGYLLEFPSDASTTDRWYGLQFSNSSALARKNSTLSNVTHSAVPRPATPLQMHLCAPCMRKALSADNIPLVLEYITHHLNIGFDHISLSTMWHWLSPHNRRLRQLLATFVAEGKVSISTSSMQPLEDDEQEPSFTMHGLAFYRIFMVVVHDNTCLYMAKGVADYALSLDLDEFLVPRKNIGRSSLRTAIAKNTLPEEQLVARYWDKTHTSRWTPEAGWADGHQHPLCFLAVQTQVVLPKKGVRPGTALRRSWLGTEFAHGPERHSTTKNVAAMSAVVHHLIPVDSIYYFSHRVAGACALPWLWNGCHSQHVDICLDADGVTEPALVGATSEHHTFDETVAPADGRTVDSMSDLVVYHFRYYSSLSANKSSLAQTNEYSKSWLPLVQEELRRRNLDLFIDLSQPEVLTSPQSGRVLPRLVAPESLHQFQRQEIENGLSLDHARTVEEALTTSESAVVQLPRFTADHSEFVLSSVIERTAEAWDLSISTFLLCHHVVVPQENHNQHVLLRVHPKAVSTWHRAITQFEKTEYSPIGLRKGQDKFECRLRNMVSDEHIEGMHEEQAYTVDAIFVPSRASVDYNANLRIDILRCPMGNSMFNYLQYAGKPRISVEVELVKNGASLIKFRVPWDSRITGYMSFSPQPIKEWMASLDDAEEVEDVEIGAKESTADEQTRLYSASSSTAIANSYAHNPHSARDDTMDSILYSLPSLSIDPWKGFSRGHLGSWSMDRVYMCVPGWRSTPTVKLLAHVYEFVQHHVMMGVEHIVLGVTFSWKSKVMKKLLRALKVFIEEGRVSLASHSPDDLDFRFALGGMSARHTPMKVIAANICMYFAKGMADYVALWDVDEFFVPMGQNRNLIDVLDKHDTVLEPPYPYSEHTDVVALAAGWDRQQRGMASAEGHPLCYMQLYSESYYRASNLKYSDPTNLWFRDNYRKTSSPKMAHKKGIHPTRRAHYVTLHTGGACKLPAEWTDCASSSPAFCFANETLDTDSFKITHNFDDKVAGNDAKHINTSTDAVIYHVQFFRWSMQVDADPNSTNDNRYARLYSEPVLRELDRRNLYLPMQLRHGSTLVETENEGEEDEAASLPASPRNASVDAPAALPALTSDHSALAVSALVTRTPAPALYVLIASDPWDGFLFPDAITLKPPQGALDRVRSGLAKWLASFAAANFSNSDQARSHCATPFVEVQCELRDASNGTVNVPGSYVALKGGVGMASCPLTGTIDNGVRAVVRLHARSGRPVHFDVVIPAGRTGAGLMFPSATDVAVPAELCATAVVEDVKIFRSSAAALAIQPALGLAAAAPSAAENTSPTVVHLCVPGGWTKRATSRSLPLLLEFVEHHVQLGVQRIYLPVPWAWNSKEMYLLAALLRSYVGEGQVALMSTVGLVAVQGRPDRGYARMQGEARRGYATTLCALLAMGTQATHLAVWDVHQFAVPRLLPQRSLGALVEGVGGEAWVLPAFRASVVDFGETFMVQHSHQSRRMWVGDSTHRAPTPLMDGTRPQAGGAVVSLLAAAGGPGCVAASSGYSGIDWVDNAARRVLERLWAPSWVAHSDSSAILHEFFHVSPRSVHCGALTAREARSMEAWATTERASYVSQMHDLCSWLDAGDRVLLLQRPVGGDEGNTSATHANLYHDNFFPAVFRGLVRRDVDLFVDGLVTEAEELQANFVEGDRAYLDYFTVYASNRFSKRNISALKVI